MSQPTAVYSTRTDLRVIASLVNYWHSQGLYPKSVSEVHRLSIELFTEILQSQGHTRRFTSTMEAKNFLEECGLLSTLNPRNKSTLTKTLQKEELINQNIDLSYLSRKSKPHDDQVLRAQEILKRKLEEEDSSGIIGGEFGKVEKDD